MTQYEYITIFTSIIFGLATVNMLNVVASMIHTDVKTQFYHIHSIWVFNLISALFLIWWDNLVINQFKEINFFHYLDLTGYSVILFIMTSLLSPFKVKTDINFAELFNKNKRKFYLTGILLCLFDFLDLILQNIDTEEKQGLPHLIFDISIFVCFLLSFIIQKKTFDWLSTILFSLGMITWFFFQAFNLEW